MKLAADAASFGVWDYDIVNDKLEWDEWMHKIYGTNPTEEGLTIADFRSFVHPDDREQTIKDEEEALALYDNYNAVFRIVRPSGEIRYINSSAVLIRDAKKRPVRVTGVNTDISERKGDELKLREREADLKAIVDNSLESIWSIDLNYNIKYVNDVFAREFFNTFGVELTKGVNLIESLPLEIRQLWKERYDRALDNEHFTFYDKIETGGAPIYIEVAMNPIIVDGKVEGASFYGKNITDRKISDEILRESEAKYRQLFENANDAILLMSGDKFIDCNKKSLEMFGCQFSDIIGKEPFKFSPRFQPDGRKSKEKALELIQKAIDGELPSFEWEHMKLDGTLFHAEVSLSHFANLGGELWIQAIVRDITYRKQVEEALFRSESNMNTILENTLESIWSVNTNFEIQYLNKTFIHTFNRIFGIELTQGSNILESLPEKSRQVWKRRMKNIQNNERVVYEDTIDNGQKKYHAEISVNPIIEDNKVIGAALYARNVTDKKNSELQIKYQSDLRKLLIDLSNSYINLPLNNIDRAIKQSLSRIGDFVGADRAYIFDYDFQKQTSSNTYEWCRAGIKPFREILQDIPMDAFREWVIAHQKGETVKVDRATDLSDNSLRLLMNSQNILSLLSIPLIFNGEVIGFVGFDSVRAHHTYNMEEEQLLQVYAQMLVNLKARLENEEKLIAAKVQAEESNRLKTAFLQNMSHEIRTPMNAILGFLGLLKNTDLKGDQQKDYADIVEISGQRLLGTINDIIEISKIEAGQAEVTLSEVKISDVLKSILNLFKMEIEKKGLSFTVSECMALEIKTIQSDRYKLEGILSNLVNNAIKFTKQGAIEIGCNVLDNSIVFHVKDTGIGIPENKFEVIFDRFVQADIKSTRPYEGSGLGLAIAKGYVKLLKGDIWVKSELNRGSTFYFSIPIMQSGSIEKAPRTGKSFFRNIQNESTILIAEDDDTSFMYLEKILGRLGVKIIRTFTGEETVKVVKENSGILLILMDIKMPGMDGLEATWQIRQFNSNVPIIAQTAYALTGDRGNAIRAGCNDYLSKPLKSADLIRLTEKYLGSLKDI